jgi:hypothetical protein
MEPESPFVPYLILVGVLLVPALVFTIAFMVMRARRGKFKHQHRRPQSSQSKR